MVVPPVTDPPQWIYRVDSRPPAEVFKDGFEPFGRNPSLIDHVRSTSQQREGGDDGFVAFTGTWASALRIAENIQSNRAVPRGLFIYLVRADSTYYSVNRTWAPWRAALVARSSALDDERISVIDDLEAYAEVA